jgi:hypothetical protein
MVSIIAFGKLYSGAKKNSTLGTLKWDLKNDFENLRIVLYSTHFLFRKICSGGGGFMKKGIVYKCSPNQFIPCNHITLVWDGQFVCFSAGSLTLYKGL